MRPPALGHPSFKLAPAAFSVNCMPSDCNSQTLAKQETLEDDECCTWEAGPGNRKLGEQACVRGRSRWDSMCA